MLEFSSLRSRWLGLYVTLMSAAGVSAACDAASVLGGTGSELVSGAACPELGSGRALGASFSGEAELDAKIGTFVQAAGDLKATATKAQDNVMKACIAIGKDIGVPSEKLQPGDDKVSQPCGAVKAKIDEILSAGATIEISWEPPKCTADASFQAKCDAECGVEVDPGRIVAECEPARLSGTCEGTCHGQCEGTCNGQCDGECTAKDASGNCTGECKGTCNGSCSATCHAKCEGEWKAPKCEAEIEGPSASADCSANCDASAEMRATCSKPKLEAKSSASAMEVQKLKMSLQRHLPALLEAQYRLGTSLKGNVSAVVKSGNSLKGELKGAGTKAVACVTAAVAAVGQASVSINVSVSASASVSGAAGASGSANAG